MKRFFLLFGVNILICLTLVVIANFLGILNYEHDTGYGTTNKNFEILVLFSMVWGFGGAFISLQLSRWMAKTFYNVELIDPDLVCDPKEKELLKEVYAISERAQLRVMPQVGIYHEAEPNAFATGPRKTKSLIAVSSGLLENMSKKEMKGVIAHEVAHIANGDMVTMTLLQGVINSFIIFVAVVLSSIIASIASKDEDSFLHAVVEFIVLMVVQVVLGLLGSIVVSYVSRKREFKADYGAAQLVGPAPIKAALQRLLVLEDRRNLAIERLKELRGEKKGRSEALGGVMSPAISGGRGRGGGRDATAYLKISSESRPRSIWVKLFSSHPPLEDRIRRLSPLGG